MFKETANRIDYYEKEIARLLQKRKQTMHQKKR